MRKTFSEVVVKDLDQGLVSAKIATLNVIDKDGDVILDGALSASDVVISAYNHTSWDGQLPVGKGHFRQDGDALRFDGQFFMDTAAGRDTFTTVKNLGPLGEWSFSLQDVVREPVKVGDVVASGIKSFRAKEVSPVLVGASIGSQTLATKAAGQTFSEHAAAVLAAVDELAARATEVVALRAEKGKSISDESAALLSQLDDRLTALKALVDKPHTTPTTDELTQEYLRFVALSAGVTQ